MFLDANPLISTTNDDDCGWWELRSNINRAGKFYTTGIIKSLFRLELTIPLWSKSDVMIKLLPIFLVLKSRHFCLHLTHFLFWTHLLFFIDALQFQTYVSSCYGFLRIKTLGGGIFTFFKVPSQTAREQYLLFSHHHSFWQNRVTAATPHPVVCVCIPCHSEMNIPV